MGYGDQPSLSYGGLRTSVSICPLGKLLNGLQHTLSKSGSEEVRSCWLHVLVSLGRPLRLLIGLEPQKTEVWKLMQNRAENVRRPDHGPASDS